MTVTQLYVRLEQQVAEETASSQLEAAQETAQIWSILLTCLQQTAQVLGALRLKGQELGKMLELALGQYQVGTIPAVLDAVSIGSVSSMRGKEPKTALCAGSNGKRHARRSGWGKPSFRAGAADPPAAV